MIEVVATVLGTAFVLLLVWNLATYYGRPVEKETDSNREDPRL